MRTVPITDWDDAYANGPYILEGDAYPQRWATRAAAYRDRNPPERFAYGPGDRDWLHLFAPESPSAGLAVFVHGGYWRALDPTSFSHLAEGARARGWAVAMPCYPLAPEARIATITASVARAIAVAADRVAGPIALAGHSAGAHLVTRMSCGALPGALRARLGRTLGIGGVYDLRPLRATAMNADLRLDAEEAMRESPALHLPIGAPELEVWVGADERPEFLRQSRLLAAAWGAHAALRLTVEPGRHHFDVIDALADPRSAMIARWLG
ncbi:MAG: alpha/beta hydrolase [Shimia sp.]